MVDEEGLQKTGSGEGGEDIGGKKGPRREGMQGERRDSGMEQRDGERKDSGMEDKNGGRKDIGPDDRPDIERSAEPDDGQGEWRVLGLDAAPEYKMQQGREGMRGKEGPQGREGTSGGEGPQGREGTGGGEGPQGGEGSGGGEGPQGGDYPGRREIYAFKGAGGRDGAQGGQGEGQGRGEDAGRQPREGGGGGERGPGGRDGGGRGERRPGWREGGARGGGGSYGRRDGGMYGGGNFGQSDGGMRGGGSYGGRDQGRRDGGRGGGGGWGGRDGPRREGEGIPQRSEGADGRPSPAEHVDREIVLPGDLLDTGKMKAGPGAFMDGESVFSSCLGIKSIRGDTVGVIPISGKYMPRVGDIVVGKVIEMTPSAWVIDLNSPYVAPLPGSETPWTVDFGETSKYMSLGDTVIVQIKDVNEIRRVGVTMMGPDLRKVVGGQTMDVDATKVPRLIGRGGSMIGLLKRLTRCHIMVGQNGRVWMDGTVEDLTVAMGAIRMIEQNAHRMGLTDAVANFIQGMRDRMEAKRVQREKTNEAAEEQAIMKDRVQRAEELKDVQSKDNMKNEEE